MKKLFLLLLLVPMLSFASGTLQVKPGYFIKANKPGGQIGLSIWEPVMGKLYFGQWMGVGIQPRVMDDSVMYAVSESSLNLFVQSVGLGVGYKFQHADKAVGSLISEHSVFVKLSKKIW